jgi:hypothetical protein
MGELASALIEAAGSVSPALAVAPLGGYGGALQDALDFTRPLPTGYYPAGSGNPGLQNDQLAAYKHELALLSQLGVGVKTPVGGFVNEGELLQAIQSAIHQLQLSLAEQLQRGTRSSPLLVQPTGRDFSINLALAQLGLRG